MADDNAKDLEAAYAAAEAAATRQGDAVRALKASAKTGDATKVRVLSVFFSFFFLSLLRWCRPQQRRRRPIEVQEKKKKHVFLLRLHHSASLRGKNDALELFLCFEGRASFPKIQSSHQQHEKRSATITKN